MRVGASTGSAERVGDDWFGSGPSRTSRVMGVAHGGQIVVSESTAVLVRSDLDAGVRLIDLGAHELRGIAEPLHLWQVSAPGSPRPDQARRGFEPVRPSSSGLV